MLVAMQSQYLFYSTNMFWGLLHYKWKLKLIYNMVSFSAFLVFKNCEVDKG